MLAREFEERGITVVEYPQSDSRVVPGSAKLHSAIIEQRITHPNDEKLNRHVTDTIARHGRRGWRVDRAERSAKIDGVLALLMANDRREHHEPEQAVKLLGWL